MIAYHRYFLVISDAIAACSIKLTEYWACSQYEFYSVFRVRYISELALPHAAIVVKHGLDSVILFL